MIYQRKGLLNMALIYKITNKINQQSYIGKTIRTLEIRLKEHKRDCQAYLDNNIPLYNAIQKYGWDNFIIEILEKDIPNENINMKEKEYIKLYNTYYQGYNATPGGDGGRTSSSLTLDQVNYIIDILLDKNSLLSFNQIGEEFNVDPSVISNINNGKAWSSDLYKYPLRKYNVTGLTLSRPQYSKIVQDLQNSNLTLQDISKKYSLSESQMTAINQGTNCYGNDNNSYYYGIYNGTFPIRTIKNKKINIDSIKKEILYEILFTKNSMQLIGEKFNIAGNTLQYIQAGKRHKDFTKEFIVPLRNNIVENQKIYSLLYNKGDD